ncbi:hypothetical protein ACFL27_23985 [candidate division CSSED10-310 bacterium]|uniref:PspA/IM30 family protein n=1 Tax=candidate division CSSED10-310 bacterium TaxID=2855610 RepID=A0ABV6Z496_UNCC1
MAQGGFSRFWQAIKRLITFKFLYESKRIDEKAEAIFTKSPDGIKAGYDLTKEKWVTQYRDLRDAIANLLELQEQRQIRLEKSEKEENELIEKREGALTLFEKTQAEGNLEEAKKHEAAFNRFHSRIEEIDKMQEELLQEITENGKELANYKLRLTEFQNQIKELEEEKQEAVADFVSSQKTIELNERLSGIATSLDSGPLAAIQKRRNELKAQAKLSSELAGTDVAFQDLQYEKAGKSTAGESAMAKMLAERKAKQKEAEEKPVQEKIEDRPEI